MVRLARLPGLAGVAPGGRGCRGIRRPGWRCRPIAVSAGMIWASEILHDNCNYQPCEDGGAQGLIRSRVVARALHLGSGGRSPFNLGPGRKPNAHGGEKRPAAGPFWLVGRTVRGARSWRACPRSSGPSRRDKLRRERPPPKAGGCVTPRVTRGVTHPPSTDRDSGQKGGVAPVQSPSAGADLSCRARTKNTNNDGLKWKVGLPHPPLCFCHTPPSDCVALALTPALTPVLTPASVP